MLERERVETRTFSLYPEQFGVISKVAGRLATSESAALRYIVMEWLRMTESGEDGHEVDLPDDGATGNEVTPGVVMR